MVETLVAVGLFAISMFGSFAVIMTEWSLTHKTEERLYVNRILQSRLEEIRHLTFDELEVLGSEVAFSPMPTTRAFNKDVNPNAASTDYQVNLRDSSGVVHIQEERGHHAVSQGPYRFVRHPMYLGILFYGSAIPVFLGSWWALIPGGLMILAFIIRTALEDRMLHEKLPGYKEYAGEVRYRLVPGVW